MNLSLTNTFSQKNKMRALFGRPKRICFVGIGGIGMHALAIFMAARGHTVVGSDRAPTPAVMAALTAHGISVVKGHVAEAAYGCDALVYSLAVPPDTPELCAARERGIPCFSRADLLGYLMADYPTRVAVAGMHGKSTVTAMTAAILAAAGKEPTVLSGAPLAAGVPAYRAGGGQIFLAEACEYRDSFLCLDPTVAVVLNAELEHTDHFHSEEQVRRSFTSFMRGAGTVILPAAPMRVGLIPPQGARVLTFGAEREADLCAENILFEGGKPAFDLVFQGKKHGRVKLDLLGEHNVLNALAAIAAAYACGLPPEAALSPLAAFRGAPMRLEEKGEKNGLLLFADYAHHPTEIRASLASLRRVARERGGRLLCLFQPHTYSRTASFFCDFVGALSAADLAILVDIYAAREQNESGVSSHQLANALARGRYAGGLAEAAALLLRKARQGDVAVVMGAGDVHRIFSLL